MRHERQRRPVGATWRLIAVMAVVLLLVSCSPPNFLRDLTKRRATSDNLTEPPSPPPIPSSLFFGIIQATYSSGWDAVVQSQGVTGSLVLEVIQGSAAAELGLKRGDIVVEISDKEIHNNAQVPLIFRSSRDPIHQVIVKRADGSTAELEVELQPPPALDISAELEKRNRERPDPVTKYLVAQTTGDIELALKLLDEAIGEAPNFAPAYTLKAERVFDRMRADPEASQDVNTAIINSALQKAVELDANASETHTTSARIALGVGDLVRAESDARQALELDDLSAEAHHLLGLARLELLREREALSDLRIAVKLDPYSLEYYVALALCYQEIDRLQDAQRTIDSAKTLTDDEAVLDQLDQVLDVSTQES